MLDQLPIVFHNILGYDLYLFIKQLRKKFKEINFGVIEENKEKQTSFIVKIKIKTPGWPIKTVKEYVKLISWAS